jgi:hypothetical protein
MNSLEQELKKYAGRSALPKRLADRIRSKLNRLQQLYGINYDPTVLAFINSPSLYLQASNIPSITKFFRRHIDIFLGECGTNNFIFSKNNNTFVRAARKPFQICIDNPYSGKAESWARIDSESKRRKDHFKNGGGSKKSRFLGNLDFIRPLEFAAFNVGLGVLESDDTMKMYLGFRNPIGNSRQKIPQSYVCLECTRIPRRQQTAAKEPLKVHGYKVRIHGYPVEPNDIENDFRGLALKMNSIPVIDNLA